MEDQILQKLNRIEKLLSGSQKQILNVDDLINYTGYTRSTIYKLVHKNIISYYKPNGKTLFFNKKEIDHWLLQNRNKSDSEIEKEAQDYINNSTQK